MIKLTVSETLNDAGALVARVAAPWVGVVWLCSMPLRFLQAYFLQQLILLNDAAQHYGDHFFNIAACICAAFVLHIYGRALFVRACNLSRQSGGAPGADVFRVPAGSFLNYLYVALILEAAFFAFSVTFVPIPIIIGLSGLAAAVAYGLDTPGVLAPLMATLRAVFGIGTLEPSKSLKGRPASGGFAAISGLVITFGVALLIVWVNLYFAFLAGLWLLGGIGGLDLSRWAFVMRPIAPASLAPLVLPLPAEPEPLTLLLAGAVVALEPYWLAAHVVYVKSVRARESGEDLKQWFDEFKREAS